MHAWNNLPECDETFISTYKHFLSTNYAKQHIATITEELYRAEQYEALQPAADDTESTLEQSQEEWMLLCQLQPTFTTRESTEENIDWEEAARQLPQPLLLSCPNWIKQMKAQTDGSIARRQCTPVDINCLNEQQMNAYHTVSTHYYNTENDQQPWHYIC